MPVTPSGILASPLDALADLLAASSQWQTWTGSADAAAAKARVHFVETTSPLRPLAVVGHPPGATIGRGGFSAGTLLLMFLADVPAAYKTSDREAAVDFLSNVGPILEQLRTGAETIDGALIVRELAIETPLRRYDEHEEDYLWMRFSVDAGIEV